jgi:RNA polymerase I-specific transcription initiation factor RRN3
VFDSHILTTHATAHVQFLLFRFLALDSEESQSNNIGLSPCTAAYLDWLWNKFQNPNTPSILRQATVCYIASLIARGKFVDLATTRIYLRQMMDWIRSYIATREERSKIGGGSNDPFFCDLKAHGPFYAACQASFYIFAFRHQEFVAGGRKEMEFLSNLGFQQVVTCSLNPLRVIMPPVVKNFTALVRHLQLAYCDTIIARNARISLPVVGSLSQSATTSGKALLLDSFFPFDPYLLKKSRGYIDDSFRTYRGVLIGNDDEEEESDEEEGESVDEEEEDMEDEDSFVSSLTKSGSIKKTDTSIIQQFMYGSSPGFKI